MILFLERVDLRLDRFLYIQIIVGEPVSFCVDVDRLDVWIDRYGFHRLIGFCHASAQCRKKQGAAGSEKGFPIHLNPPFSIVSG